MIVCYECSNSFDCKMDLERHICKDHLNNWYRYGCFQCKYGESLYDTIEYTEKDMHEHYAKEHSDLPVSLMLLNQCEKKARQLNRIITMSLANYETETAIVKRCVDDLVTLVSQFSEPTETPDEGASCGICDQLGVNVFVRYTTVEEKRSHVYFHFQAEHNHSAADFVSLSEISKQYVFQIYNNCFPEVVSSSNILVPSPAQVESQDNMDIEQIDTGALHDSGNVVVQIGEERDFEESLENDDDRTMTHNISTGSLDHQMITQQATSPLNRRTRSNSLQIGEENDLNQVDDRTMTHHISTWSSGHQTMTEEAASPQNHQTMTTLSNSLQIDEERDFEENRLDEVGDRMRQQQVSTSSSDHQMVIQEATSPQNQSPANEVPSPDYPVNNEQTEANIDTNISPSHVVTDGPSIGEIEVVLDENIKPRSSLHRKVYCQKCESTGTKPLVHLYKVHVGAFRCPYCQSLGLSSKEIIEEHIRSKHSDMKVEAENWKNTDEVKEALDKAWSECFRKKRRIADVVDLTEGVRVEVPLPDVVPKCPTADTPIPPTADLHNRSTSTSKSPQVECVLCEQTVSRAREHLMKKHVEERTIKCFYCQYETIHNINSVKRHIRAEHKGEEMKIIDKSDEFEEKIKEMSKQCYGEEIEQVEEMLKKNRKKRKYKIKYSKEPPLKIKRKMPKPARKIPSPHFLRRRRGECVRKVRKAALAANERMCKSVLQIEQDSFHSSEDDDDTSYQSDNEQEPQTSKLTRKRRTCRRISSDQEMDKNRGNDEVARTSSSSNSGHEQAFDDENSDSSDDGLRDFVISDSEYSSSDSDYDPTDSESNPNSDTDEGNETDDDDGDEDDQQKDTDNDTDESVRGNTEYY